MVDEEGPRFGAAIFGSRALAGELDVDEILARTDPEGNVLRDLAALRGVTAATVRAAPAFLPRVASWIEVHVEQGRRLVDVPAPLGVATALAARERWRCTLRGVSDHAGTAAMAGRRDALVPAARAVARGARARAGGARGGRDGGAHQRAAGIHEPGAGRGAPEPRRPRARARRRSSACATGCFAAARAEGIEAEWLCESADPGCVFDSGLREALHARSAGRGPGGDRPGGLRGP